MSLESTRDFEKRHNFTPASERPLSKVIKISTFLEK